MEGEDTAGGPREQRVDGWRVQLTERSGKKTELGRGKWGNPGLAGREEAEQATENNVHIHMPKDSIH